MRTPRATWIETARQAFIEGGPSAVRVEKLASRLGVTKGGFYWHFPDRAALVAEMLDAWERTWTDDIIARVESRTADPQGRLNELFSEAPTSEAFRFEMALREWAPREAAAAERLKRVDTRRLAYLCDLFRQVSDSDEEAEARSMLAYSLVIGSYFIAATHGERSRAEVLRSAAARVIGRGGALGRN